MKWWHMIFDLRPVRLPEDSHRLSPPSESSRLAQGFIVCQQIWNLREKETNRRTNGEKAEQRQIKTRTTMNCQEDKCCSEELFEVSLCLKERKKEEKRKWEQEVTQLLWRVDYIINKVNRYKLKVTSQQIFTSETSTDKRVTRCLQERRTDENIKVKVWDR